VLGVRVAHVPHLGGVAVVNGFAGVDGASGAETMGRTPYPVAAGLSVDGLELDAARERARLVRQAYDFATGELHSHFVFEADTARADVDVTTFCSRTLPTVVLQETVVSVDRACDLVLAAGVDERGVPGTMLRRRTGDGSTIVEQVDGSLAWRSHGDLGVAGAAYCTEFLGAEPERSFDRNELRPLQTRYAIRARTGRRYRLRQITALVPDVMHSQPDLQAVRLCHGAAQQGFERLRADNDRAWREIWEGRVRIDAPSPWQELADAAFFYLNTSVHPSTPASTSMYGLATWQDYHYYYGHVMWDIEFFGVPPLLLVQPDAARALLDFRRRTLPAARSNARLNGRQGLQFPWEAGSVAGEEASPGAGHASWHEDHVSLDVAWAFAQYAHATGDARFLRDDAEPVLSGVADWIASRVTPIRDGYAWLETMGIAERRTPSDNEAFTLMMARTVLDEAIACAGRLGAPVRTAWRNVRDGLRVSPSQRLGAILSHDGFNPGEEKGHTPGPLAGIFPAWFALDPGVEQATLRYYLDLAEGYIGSPMLSPLYGVWACWAGDRRLAARLYEEGYANLIGERFRQTLEQSRGMFPDSPPSGPFFANLGGFLMGLLYGLPGIRLGPGEPATWPARPVVLPAGWRSIEVERAWAHGEPVRIVARHGAERAEIGNGRRRRTSRAA